jgi:putative FmdB family regulatory protein
MPIYEYRCKACGPFEDFCSMGDFAKPMSCPSCRELAPRQVAAAQLNRMTGSNRKAHSLNEKNSNEPRIARAKSCNHDHHGHGHNQGHNHGHKHVHQHGGADRPWMVGH